MAMTAQLVWAGMPTIETRYIYAQGGESLRALLINETGVSGEVLDRGYLKKIRGWNFLEKGPLKKNARIYVELPYGSFSVSRRRGLASVYRRPAVINKRAYRKVSSTAKLKMVKKPSASFSVFYALSKGALSEVTSSGKSVASSQDMPFTVGAAFGRDLYQDTKYSGSIYLAKLDSGLSSGGENIEYPMEYGLTSYLGYKKRGWFAQIYGGLDYEHFSSLNSDEMEQGMSLATREHSLGYLTAGVSKGFSFLGRSFFTKASYSYSLISSQSRASLINPNAFKGVKFILFLSMKAVGNWSYSCFYKQHSLTGATSLQISRLGIGMGYRF